MEPLAPTPRLALARPPREVPFRTALALRLSETMVQIGAVTLAVFGAVSISLFANADIASLWRYRGELERVEARVTAVARTGEGEGGGRRSRRSRPIVRFEVEFEHGGARRTAVSYSSTKRVDPGASVNVEFPRDQPQYARIVGMRSDVFGPNTLLFVCLAPGMAGFMLVFGLVRSARALRLVRTGSVAQGVVQSVEQSVGRRPVRKQRRAHHVSVEFESEPGRSTLVHFDTSHTERFRVGRRVHVLFEAHEPERASVVEDFSLELPLDGRGRIAEVGFSRLARYAALPGLSVVVLLVALVLV